MPRGKGRGHGHGHGHRGRGRGNRSRTWDASTRDWVVSARNVSQLEVARNLRPYEIRAVRRFTVESALPLRTTNGDAGAGFYSHHFGYLPFAWSRAPVEAVGLGQYVGDEALRPRAHVRPLGQPDHALGPRVEGNRQAEHEGADRRHQAQAAGEGFFLSGSLGTIPIALGSTSIDETSSQAKVRVFP